MKGVRRIRIAKSVNGVRLTAQQSEMFHVIQGKPAPKYGYDHSLYLTSVVIQGVYVEDMFLRHTRPAAFSVLLTKRAYSVLLSSYDLKPPGYAPYSHRFQLSNCISVLRRVYNKIPGRARG